MIDILEDLQGCRTAAAALSQIALCGCHSVTALQPNKLQILRHIPLKLASADIDDLHLHIFLGDADADVVAHRREVVAFHGGVLEKRTIDILKDLQGCRTTATTSLKFTYRGCCNSWNDIKSSVLTSRFYAIHICSRKSFLKRTKKTSPIRRSLIIIEVFLVSIIYKAYRHTSITVTI